MDGRGSEHPGPEAEDRMSEAEGSTPATSKNNEAPLPGGFVVFKAGVERVGATRRFRDIEEPEGQRPWRGAEHQARPEAEDRMSEAEGSTPATSKNNEAPLPGGFVVFKAGVERVRTPSECEDERPWMAAEVSTPARKPRTGCPRLKGRLPPPPKQASSAKEGLVCFERESNPTTRDSQRRRGESGGV